MPRKINLTGCRFGRLIIIKDSGLRRQKRAIWVCLCDCGGKIIAASSDLLRGNVKSCGCLRKELVSKAFLKHGHNMGPGHHTPEYASWANMLTRCRNRKTGKDWFNYGGRGIKVCKRWQGKCGFENFLKDMGLKPEPKKKYSLDRIDVNGDYKPSNCKWSSFREQAINRRSFKAIQNYTDAEFFEEAKRRGFLFVKE